MVSGALGSSVSSGQILSCCRWPEAAPCKIDMVVRKEIPYGQEALVVVSPQESRAGTHVRRHYVIVHGGNQTLYVGTSDASDTRRFIDNYRRASSGEDLVAITKVALAFLKGEGVNISLALSSFYFFEAAAQGFSFAQNGLGVSYALGLGVPKSDEEAVFWYSQAARQGNPDGLFHYGKSLLEGKGVEQDTDNAVFYFFNAALHGHKQSIETLQRLADVELVGEAQFAISSLWYMGCVPGWPRNFHKARIYLEKAARNGVAEACSIKEDIWKSRLPNLALLTEAFAIRGGQRCRTAYCERKSLQDVLQRGLRRYEERNYILARSSFMRASFAIPFAWHMLGWLAFQGLGEKRDVQKARRCFAYALSGGCLNPVLPLVQILLEEGTEEGEKLSREVLEMGARAGIAPAQGKLALWCFRGIGGGCDEELARHWVLEAHKNGHFSTLVMFGAILSSEEEFKDEKLAFECFKLAAESNKADPLFYLGDAYLRGIGTEPSVDMAMKYFTQAAQLGHPYAADLLRQLASAIG